MTEKFIDKILSKIQKETILHLAGDEVSAHDIAQELNISEPYVNEVIAEADAELVQEANRMCQHSD